MRQRRWLELLSDYDYEIRYHPGKANVCVIAFLEQERNERIKPLRVRALVMTIGLDLPKKILMLRTDAGETIEKKRTYKMEKRKHWNLRADGTLCLNGHGVG
ncbi:hypothetical protein Tco_1112085 [Tanacetum coccineum]|uniref:Reverse transcriptase domain-containing protein n=1 Tax=Tanacetum coccineum TaxID=301880 RepID=A0ABQ5AID6_9ASTR